MKVIVNLIDKTLKILENEKNIYVGNNNADVLKLYCYNGGYHLENEFVSITGLLSNGRKIGPFTTDSAYDEEYIDGKLHIVANFTLTKQNGFTLSEGQLNITIWHNKTNDSGAIISKQAIGNLLFNVVKTTNVDENIIITDASGDVIYNFQLEIENLQSAVNSVNNELLLKADKSDIPTKTSQLENDTDYVDSERLTDVADSLEAQIKRNGGKNYYLSSYTSSNGIRELATTLYDYDEEFQSTNVGKFYVELGDGTIIENLYLKRFSGTQGVNYYLNSIIRENNTIKVYLGTLPRTKMTISDFINKHSQIATVQDIADLINSAPTTLDTLGELAAALQENDEVLEVLNEAISKKADITYVDEKVANAGVPTDLLDRVETLETKIPTKTSQLTNDSAFINQTQLDEALANLDVGGGTGGSVGLYKHYINFYVAGDDYEYAIKLELYLKRKERIQDFATLLNCINKQVTYHCLIQDTGDTMYFYSGSIYFDTSYLRISFMVTDDVCIEKDVDYNVIEDYYNNVEDSEFEVLEGTIGGASGDYVPIKTRYAVPQNTFSLSGNQSDGFILESNLGDISNKVVYWDWLQEQAIYDPQLGGAIQEIVIDLTNGTFTYGNKNFTLYIYLDVARGGEWDPNINSDTGFTISLPAMWTWQIDGVLGNKSASEIVLEGGVDHTCNPNGDGNYLWFYMPNLDDLSLSANLTFRIDVDNEGFATFTILQDYVY